MTHKIEDKKFGTIVIRQSKRAKRLRMSMKPFGPLNVSVPYGTKPDVVHKFITTNKDWIIKTKNKINSAENRRTVFTPDTIFNTKYRELKLLPILRKPEIQVQIKPKTIIVRYSESTDIQSDAFQNTVRKIIEESLRDEAKRYLPNRIYELAAGHNLSLNKVSVRKAKTRWGSCSSQNNISLNIHLMRLPDDLIDYVLLHELAHTVHKNHSRNFWNFLSNICPNAKLKDKELRNYSPTLW